MSKIFSTVPQVTGENVTIQAISTPPTLAARFVSIVVEFIRNFGTQIAEATHIATPGQGIASAVFLALGEMRWGLPTAGLVIPGQDPVWVDLAKWGHGACRDQRVNRKTGEASGKTFLFEGGHATTEQARQQICDELGINRDDLVIVKFGSNAITTDEMSGEGKDRIPAEIVAAGNAAGMTEGDWESGKVLLVPAGLGALSTLQFVALYRICGQWPVAVRVAAAAQGEPFQLAELIPLQPLREQGRQIVCVDAPVSVTRDLYDEVLAALPEGPARERFAALAG